ncbi:MAG: hypothetical protein QF704_04060 [Anaerolineales bacterium]|nr:hypothetical protein [Anaerolineales bacterium]
MIIVYMDLASWRIHLLDRRLVLNQDVLMAVRLDIMDGTAKLHVPTQIVLETNVTLWMEDVMMDVKTKSGLMMVERNVQPSVLHFARVDSARQRVLESATWAVIQLIMVKNAPKHARKPHARRIARNPTVRVPGEHVISYHLHHTARMILTQAVTLRGFAFRPASQAITVLNARKSVLTIVRLLVLRIRQSVHPVRQGTSEKNALRPVQLDVTKLDVAPLETV